MVIGWVQGGLEDTREVESDISSCPRLLLNKGKKSKSLFLSC